MKSRNIFLKWILLILAIVVLCFSALAVSLVIENNLLVLPIFAGLAYPLLMVGRNLRNEMVGLERQWSNPEILSTGIAITAISAVFYFLSQQ